MENLIDRNKGMKSEVKNDAESERIMRGELTRKPLDRCIGNPKKSELYPTKALGETEEEINDQEDDISDEGTDSTGTDKNFDQSSISTTVNVHNKEGGKMPRNRKKKSSSNAPKKADKVYPKPKLQQQSKNFGLKQFLCGLLVIVSVSVSVSVIVLYFIYVRDTQSLTITPTLNIDAIISSLKPEFRKQPKMSFRVIQTALKAVNKTEPTAPAIILLLAAEGAEKQSRDLGQKLVEAISPNFLTISGVEYKNLNYDDGKKHIDDQLHSLSENKYDAVLVEDLHLIPGGTALMFHSYCDHENAPYKRAVYVMTVASGVVIPSNSTNKFWDETTQNRLTRSWSDINDDQMAPLLARLTVGVAAITADNL